jgi:fatty acid desaturase
MTTTVSAAQRGSDYARLSRLVRNAGLLRRRPGYYTVKITVTGLLFVGGWVAFFLIGQSWFNLITAGFLAAMATQVAFIGHDAGHKQIFRTNRSNYVLGLLHGNLGIGLSYGWWIDKHNRHHAHPNDTERDPDIKVGALVYTKRQAAARPWVGRLLSRLQAFLFFPMLMLEGLNLHASSIRALTGRTVKSRRLRALEAASLLLHIACYLTAIFVVLSPWQAIAFIALHQGVFGIYMGLSFAPNHKGMPVLGPGEELDYLRRQVLTSRNVRGGWLTDLVLGGLNYQIEHHLFPNMPRPTLRRSQPLIRRFCAEHGISYTQTSLWRSYGQVLRHLYSVGSGLRPRAAT